jgi:2-polyprenyl-6-methoxyphenol hydroxylase-like FAD-dependent oxidoreductase
MTRTAEIAGGGIAGLAMAWALARRGWRVTVHERSPEIREIGAGIFLMSNSLSIFEHHDIAAPILKRSIRLEATERREYDGRLIQKRMLSGDDRWLVVPRSDLVLGLAAVARQEGAEIRTGSQAVSIDPNGTLTLDTGEVRKADLVIVADGFRSKLRTQLGLTEFARERSSGATRLIFPRTAAETEPMAREYWSGRRRVGIAPCAPDLTYAYLSCPNSDQRGVTVPIDVASWQDAFPTIAPFFERLPQAIDATRHPYAYAKASAWSKGRAVIIGDACHALPPTLAQGAGLAIVNGYALAETLAVEPDIGHALAEWERKYRPIAEQTQYWSIMLDVLTTRWPRPLSFMRRAVLWGIGRSNRLNYRIRIADRVRVASGDARSRAVNIVRGGPRAVG